MLENLTISVELNTALKHESVIEYRTDILVAIQKEELRVSEAWRFVKWRIWRDEHGFSGPATKQEVNAFLLGNQFTAHSSLLSRACSVITPALADASVIQQNRDQTNRRRKARRKQTSDRPICRHITVASGDLPVEWRSILTAMSRGDTGANGKYVRGPGQISRLERTLRAICFTCDELGTPFSISRESVVNYVQALQLRGNSHVSISSRLTELKQFLQYSGITPWIIEELSSDINMHNYLGRKEEKRKETFLKSVSLTQADIAYAACKVLAKINTNRGKAVHENTRRARSRDAALLGLSLGAAPRPADLTELIVDVSMKREADVWMIDYKTLKTGEEIEFPLDRMLTPFLDQAILFGASGANLRKLYAIRRGMPFFVADNSFQKLASCWSGKRMREHIGIGANISRTLWYNAEYDRSAGDIETARAILGHRGRKIHQAYLTPKAYANAAVKAASVLTDLAEDALN